MADSIDALLSSDALAVTRLTVISATKINKKVTQVLKLLFPERFDENAETSGRQVIVAITAKAASASKLVSVVEITKRDAAQYRKAHQSKQTIEGGGETKQPQDGIQQQRPTIFQYTAVHGMLDKPKPERSSMKRKRGADDLVARADQSTESKSNASAGTAYDGKEDTETGDAHAEVLVPNSAAEPDLPTKGTADDADDADNADEEEQFYETFRSSAAGRAVGAGRAEKQQQTAVLTIYLSRAAVKELKVAYGEQVT